jgi:MoxR-like ATPase
VNPTVTETVTIDSPDDVALADKMKLGRDQILTELRKTIVGQEDTINQVLLSLFVGGNSLIVGVPGLAKTLLIHTLARVVDLKFNRIQFTPDLMPSDITGVNLLSGQGGFSFRPGPIFGDLVLGDEINRAPAKTQAALLEAMQERQVTAGRVRHPLADPFFVLATQNPIEQEGTYPLPEAQQDRFMFKVYVRYPSFDEEFEIARRTTTTLSDRIEPVLTAAEILDLQRLVREVPVSDHVIRYTLSLVRQTRVGEPGVPDFVDDQVSWGAGPRAVQFLVLGAKARALLHGRTHVSTDDIQALARPVLRHRLVINFAAQSDGVTADTIVDRLLSVTPAKEDELTRDARFQKIFAS